MSAVILQPAVPLHTAGAADYRHKRGLPHSSIGAPSSRPMFMVRRKTRTGPARPLVRANNAVVPPGHDLQRFGTQLDAESV